MDKKSVVVEFVHECGGLRRSISVSIPIEGVTFECTGNELYFFDDFFSSHEDYEVD